MRKYACEETKSVEIKVRESATIKIPVFTANTRSKYNIHEEN